jgi:hypothetical protein
VLLVVLDAYGGVSVVMAGGGLATLLFVVGPILPHGDDSSAGRAEPAPRTAPYYLSYALNHG